MERKIFISRAIDEDSFFYKKLRAEGFDVFGMSLLNFVAMPFDEIPETDWIFFYSKNGVKFFFENIRKKQLELSNIIQLAGFGTATSAAIEMECGRCDFTGTGEANTTADLFLKKAKDQKVLFARAENSRQSVQQLVDNEVVVNDLVVYDNFQKQNIKIPKAQFLVFTSPLNAKVFFQNKKLEQDRKVFAIGGTTAKALLDLGIEKVIVPNKPTVKELVNVLLSNA